MKFVGRAALWILGSLCLVEFAAIVWQRDRLLYFRSKTEELQLQADLSRTFPIGSDEQEVLAELGAVGRAALVHRAGGDEVLLRPSLPVAPTRDYRGFRFRFMHGRLVGILPIGPDPPAMDIDLGPVLRPK